MNQLIGVLLPSIISLKMHDKFFGEENNLKKRIELYLNYVLFVNLFSYIVIVYILKKPLFIFTNQFTIKYIILSLIFATILPIIKKIIKYNIEIKVEENEKKD